MWCAPQVQPCPLARMVNVAVATPHGDPCGGVPRGDFGELSSSPQNFRGAVDMVLSSIYHPLNICKGPAKKAMHGPKIFTRMCPKHAVKQEG